MNPEITRPRAKHLETYGYDVAMWFRRSGIQHADGGVSRYYLSDQARNAPVSSEITGYAISLLVELFRDTGSGVYLEQAKAAAKYLMAAWDVSCGGMPFEPECGEERLSYFFDNGIIVRGLLALWRETQDVDALALATLCAESMMKDFSAGTSYAPIISLPEKQALPYDGRKWSRQPGCYQLKAALGWLELEEATGEVAYGNCYRSCLEQCVSTHATFLQGTGNHLGVMDRLHAYLYFLEGLLPRAREKRNAELIAQGIILVSQHMRRLEPEFLRCDVVAQLLRMRLCTSQLEICRLDERFAEQEVSWLLSFQSSDEVLSHKGGFWFGRKGKEILPFMNPWASAFSWQALSWWESRGQQVRPWECLI